VYVRLEQLFIPTSSRHLLETRHLFGTRHLIEVLRYTARISEPSNNNKWVTLNNAD